MAAGTKKATFVHVFGEFGFGCNDDLTVAFIVVYVTGRGEVNVSLCGV